jgi:hypothetical protein
MTPPNLKKRIYKKEYAKELLKIAAGDLDSAVELSQAKTGRPENIDRPGIFVPLPMLITN